MPLIFTATKFAISERLYAVNHAGIRTNNSNLKGGTMTGGRAVQKASSCFGQGY